MSLPEYVTINGTRHVSANLSEAAKAQVLNIQIAEAEVTRLQQQLALAQTARAAYFSVLMAELKHKNKAEAEEVKPKKVRAPRKAKTAAPA